MTINRNLSILAEGVSSTGILNPSNGGTGLSSLTAGYIPFGNGTSAFGSSSNLFWNSANNRFGIGTTSPQAPIDVAYGTYGSLRTYAPGISQTYHMYRGTPDGTGYEHSKVLSDRDTTAYTYASYLAFYTEQKNTANGTDTSTEKMRIFGSGGVSIGNTTDPGATNLSVTGSVGVGGSVSSSYQLNVYNTTVAGAALFTSPSGAGNGGNSIIALSSTASSNQRNLTFGIDETNGWTWQSNIQQGVGTTTHRFYTYTTYAGSYTGNAWYQGNNTTTWSTTSDVRIKKDIASVENGLEIVNSLRPVNYYNLITEKNETNFIAQEYEQVLPDHVTEEKATEKELDYCLDGKIKRLNPNLIPYLVDAIQTLTARLELLERKANDNTNT